MKRLVALLCTVASCRSQYSSGQYNPFQFTNGDSGFGGNTQLLPPPVQNSFGANFDLLSNSNNFFSQQPQDGFQTSSQNAFNTFSGFPFTTTSYDSRQPNSFHPSVANFNYRQPQQSFDLRTGAQPSYQQSQLNVAQPGQPSSYQTYPAQTPQPSYQTPPVPQPAYQASVRPAHHAPVQAAYQVPVQSAYQSPIQPVYQGPAQAAYRAPVQPDYQARIQPHTAAHEQITAPRPAPFINRAQLSYNAAGPSQSVAKPSSASSEKPTSYHPPAPVHYVSIGEKLEGDYKFGYETGKGSNGDESFRSETRDTDGTVRGSYGYVDSSGKRITVHYEAGREGFRILSEDEVKNGRKTIQQQAPQHSTQSAVEQNRSEITPVSESSNVTLRSATPQRRRKRRPNQA